MSNTTPYMRMNDRDYCLQDIGCKTMTAKYRLSALLLSCLPMTFIEAQAEDIPLIDDASLSGKARTVYYDIENTEKDSTSGAWTGALWLDLRSGYIEDIVGFGLSYYGVTKLNMPDNNVHSNQLLDDQNKGFGKLGQAYVELKLPSSPSGPAASFTAGRLTKRNRAVIWFNFPKPSKFMEWL